MMFRSLQKRALRRLMRRSHREQRGIALVMVLGALTILTVMLTEFQDESSAELGSALSARDALKAEYAARSGINLSRLLIASEPTIRKALAPLAAMMGQQAPQIPVWAFADQVLGAFNDEEGAKQFQQLASVDLNEGENLGLDVASFDIQIVDEDSKININAGARDLRTQTRFATQLLGLIGPPQYSPLFDRRDVDGNFSSRQAICSAIIDWADSNQELFDCNLADGSAPTGAAEDSYYRMLDEPYRRKNAPYDSLEELRMVRGIGDDFWATFVEPDYADPDSRTLTVWGQGKLNINTANAQTLVAIICGMAVDGTAVCNEPDQTLMFVGMINLVRQFTKGMPLLGSPKAFISALQHKGMLGQLFKSFGVPLIQFKSQSETAKVIAVESKVFSLYSTGRVKSGQRETRVRVHAVVDFRGAPALPQMSSQMRNQLQSLGYDLSSLPGGAAGATGAQGGTAGNSGNLGDEAIVATLQPQPGGRIIYYRMD